MEIDVQFFVIKLDGQVISVYPLQDIYSHVQISLDKENLTEEDVYNYYKHMSRSYQLRRLADVLEKGYLIDEQEAKDMCCKLSQYEMTIITKTIQF